MSSARTPRLLIALSLLAIALSFAFSTIFFLTEQSDSFAEGVDHPFVHSFLNLYNEYFPFGDTWTRSVHPTADCLPSYLTVGAALVLGLRPVTCFAVMWLGMAMLLLVGAAVARELTGQRWTGWFAAALLAATPHVYYLTWSYNNWLFLAVFYLATIYTAIRLVREPAAGRAIAVGLCIALGQFSGHDYPSRDLFVIYCAIAVLVALAIFARQKRLTKRQWIAYPLLIALCAESITMVKEILRVFREGLPALDFFGNLAGTLAWRYGPERAAYYTHNIGEYSYPPHWWWTALPGYLYDLAFQALAPMLFVFVLLMFARFQRLSGQRFPRAWLLAPVLALAVASLSEKKNFWYILPLIPALTTLAASVFAATAPVEEKPRRVLTTVILGLLTVQLTVFCWIWPPQLPDWMPKVTDQKAELSRRLLVERSESKHMMVARVLHEFDRRFAPGQTIGLAMLDAHGISDVTDFYLRCAARPLKLHLPDRVEPARVQAIFWLVNRTFDDRAPSLLAEPRAQLWEGFVGDLRRLEPPLNDTTGNAATAEDYRAWIEVGEIVEVLPNRLLLFPPATNE
ncbi:MAG TPA: hypothetical protein PK961_01290 [bacterium]|nr:hypothetical protein [bacterium]